MHSAAAHALGKSMRMSVHWGWDISFVFEELTVHQQDTGLIILGMAVSILISILSVALPTIKARLTNKAFLSKQHSSLKIAESEYGESDDERVLSKAELAFNFGYIFSYSVMQILTMMLIMTYNGYVIMAVMLGYTIGYTVFGMEADKDKNIPVNCCA